MTVKEMIEPEFDKERAQVKASLQLLGDCLCLLISTDPIPTGSSISASCEYNGMLITFNAFVGLNDAT